MFSIYLSIFCSAQILAQSIDFKGYFFIQSFRNQKGIENDSIKDVFLKTSKGTFFVKDCNNLLPSTNDLHLKKAIVRGKFEKGPLDNCNDRDIHQSRYGEHIVLEDFVLESNFSYSLSDGSGNRYILEGNVLMYLPVSKEMSSSGMYSGGTKKEKVLSKNERIMLIRNFRKTIKKTRLTLCPDGRPKESLNIRFSQLGEDKEYCCAQSKSWKKFITRNKLCLQL
jgi:hypothetical protein